MDGNGRSCPACRAELRGGARFCPRCGHRQLETGPEPANDVFEDPAGPGNTIIAQPAPARPAGPPSGPPSRSAPSPGGGDWSDWYTTTAPRQEFPPGPPAGPRPAPPQQHAPQGFPGFEPFRPYQPQEPPPAQPFPPRRDDRHRSRDPLALFVVVALLVIGGGAYALVAQPWKSHETLRETASTGSPTASHTASASGAAVSGHPGQSASATAGASSTASSPAPSTSAASSQAVTEQQAATNVASMLTQSGSDRAAIVAAYNDVYACGPNLAADAKAFTDAATSRRSMLSSLAAMPGRSTLPPALLTDLTKAWQASIAADQDYARWATDESGQGCVTGDTSDPAYQAAVTPNNQATANKTAFASEWNPIAAEYGLRQYTASQL